MGNLTYSFTTWQDTEPRWAAAFAQTGLPLPISSASYNANNQVTAWGTANLFYDENGNMLSDGSNSNTSGALGINWRR